MKRIWSVALLIGLALVVGCASKEQEPVAPQPQTEVQMTAIPAERETIEAEPEPTEAVPEPQYDGWFVLPEGWTYFADKSVQYFDGTGKISIMVTEVGTTAVSYLDRTKEQWQATYDASGMECTINGVERTLVANREASIISRTDADGTLCDIYVLWTPDRTYMVTVTADGQDGLTEARSVVDTFRVMAE